MDQLLFELGQPNIPSSFEQIAPGWVERLLLEENISDAIMQEW